MRRYLAVFLFGFFAIAHAADTLRVGSDILAVGDSAVRVRALLGKPSFGAGKSQGNKGLHHANRKAHGGKSKTASRHAKPSADKGERWQYRVDNHTAIITIVDGKVARIEETAG